MSANDQQRVWYMLHVEWDTVEGEMSDFEIKCIMSEVVELVQCNMISKEDPEMRLIVRLVEPMVFSPEVDEKGKVRRAGLVGLLWSPKSGKYDWETLKSQMENDTLWQYGEVYTAMKMIRPKLDAITKLRLEVSGQLPDEAKSLESVFERQQVRSPSPPEQLSIASNRSSVTGAAGGMRMASIQGSVRGDNDSLYDVSDDDSKGKEAAKPANG